MEEVKGDILRLLKTRGKKTGDGEQTSCCVVCGAGINLLGTEELSGEKVGVVLQALLVDQKNEAGAEDTNNGRLEACWQCSKSLRTLIDLFNQLEDFRERFNDLRRLIGRQVILGSLGRPEESFARWMEEVKSVEDVYPSRAIRKLRKMKVKTAEAVVKVEWDAEDFEFCVEPVNDHLDKVDGIIGDLKNDHLEVSEFVINPDGYTRKDSPRKDVKLTKMRPVVVLNRSFGFGIVSAKPASKNGKPVKKTVQVNMNEIKSKDNKPETDLSRSARRPPIKSPTFSTEEKRKKSIPRKILEETIRTPNTSEVQRGHRFESFEYGDSLSKGDVEVFGSEDKSRRFGKRQRLDDTLENSKPQSGKDKEDINNGPFEKQDDEFRPSDNNDSDEESEESSDAECTSVKLNRPSIRRKPDKRVRKRIRTSGTTTKKQCLLCGKAFDRPWRLRLHIEEFHSGVPKKTSRRKNHMGRIRTAQRAQEVGSDSMIKEKEFPCTHCDLTFRNLKRLSSHQLQTHWLGSEVPGSLQCRYCMKFFLEETLLIAHLAKTHKTVQTEASEGDGDVESQGPSEDRLKLKKQSPVHIQCFQCKTTFSTVEELEVHAGTKEHQETLKSKVTVHCNVCRLKLNDPDALQDHLKSEAHLEELKTLGDYNNGTFCVPCRLDLGSHEGLIAHNKLTVHRRKCIFRKNYPQDGERLEVPDKCHLCGGTFNFARSLENHMKVSHKEGGYTCEICGKNFILLRDFKSHRKRHGAPKPFVCEVCGKEFIDERNLRQHAERFHLGEKSICAVCGKEFPSRATLEAHEASVHFPSRRKSFTCQCTFCPEVFKKPVILRRHLYEGHREEYLKETTYACLVCFHLFPTSEALESHSASHEELKCPTCGKGFRYKIFLDNHLRAHTGEKPFACTQCDKKFSYSSGLKEHMLGHNEKRKRPFICSCGTGFVRNRSLKLHKDKTGH